jgi:probable HAF family extracellular repeat protein
MTDLYPLNSRALITVGPTGINTSGQIASGVTVVGIYYPAIYNSTTGDLSILGSLGGITSYGFTGVATSINNNGQAVGYSYVDDIYRHAFLYSNGVISDLGSFGGHSVALAINDRGMIVGSSSDVFRRRSHAFLYNNGAMEDINPLGILESCARGINRFGQVVGEFLTADGASFHAFLYDNGTFQDLGSADSPESIAYAINDYGRVVGITYVPDEGVRSDPDTGAYDAGRKYKPHGFLYENGEIIDLNTLIPPGSGWELTSAFAINSEGQIVGAGLLEGKVHAFLGEVVE